MNGIDLDRIEVGLNLEYVQEARAHFDLNREEIVIIYAGRLVKTKDVDGLIEGFISAYRKNNNLRLLIAGDPQKETYGDFEYFNLLQSISSQVPIGVIQFLGWLNRSELEFLYKAGDISILLSTKEGGESNSLFLMESMAYGLACIATNVGGNPEVLGNAGILLAPEKVKENLPKRILEISNKDTLENFRQLSKQRAEFFSYKRMAKELIEFVYQN